jgi:uncharacterized protein YrrD
MSERFAAAAGRKVVSRANAETLGDLAHMVVEVNPPRVTLLVVGKGRKARLVTWGDVSGFGPDAVMISDEANLQPPRDEREEAAADGKFDLIGKLALSDMGNDLGKVTDIVFDPDTGVLETIVLDEHEEPAASLVGAGSFATIIHPGG